MATISGKWIFNDTISLPDYVQMPTKNYTSVRLATISFTTNVPEGSTISPDKIFFDIYRMSAESYILRYGDSSAVNRYAYRFATQQWVDVESKYIDFGENPQDVSAGFYTWFAANAVQEGNTPKTTITYNESEIASLEAGQTAIFPEGKKATDDVSITFGANGSITYKGVTTEVEKGKTARLLFKGKKLATDVVIALEKNEESTLISFTISELSTPVQYQAEEGMTWRDWCESEYDNSPVAANESYVIDKAGDGFVHKYSGSMLNWVVQYNDTRVSPTDIIQAGVVYDCAAWGNEGSND